MASTSASAAAAIDRLEMRLTLLEKKELEFKREMAVSTVLPPSSNWPTGRPGMLRTRGFPRWSSSRWARTARRSRPPRRPSLARPAPRRRVQYSVSQRSVPRRVLPLIILWTCSPRLRRAQWSRELCSATTSPASRRYPRCGRRSTRAGTPSLLPRARCIPATQPPNHILV